MPPAEGRQWALVVFGPPALVFVLVGLAYGVLFVVPGAPCGSAGAVATPATDVAVAFDGANVSAVYADSEPLDRVTTDRVVVAVRDSATGETVSRRWVGSRGQLSRGDTLTIEPSDAAFQFTATDTVFVRWYGVDRSAPGFCPNGRTSTSLAVVRLANASTPIGTT